MNAADLAQALDPAEVECPRGECLPAALWYAAAGLAVLPLQWPLAGGGCSCGNRACSSSGKHPLTPHGVKDATRDAATIREWFRRWPQANIGIATGAASGLMVVDLDPRNGAPERGELPALFGDSFDTAEAVTGGGGRHLFFRDDSGSAYGKSPWLGVDLQGAGKYVVAAPSLHPSGRRYEWDGTDGAESLRTLAPVPSAVAACRKSAEPKAAAQKPTEARQLAPGGRNSGLTATAGAMRRRGLSETAIVAALLVENAERCNPPLPESEVRAIAASVGRYEPAPAPVVEMPSGEARANRLEIECNDAGNGGLLAERYGDDMLWCPERNTFMVWTGTHYEPDPGGVAVERLAEETIRAQFGRAGAISDRDTRKAVLRHLCNSLNRYGLSAMTHAARRKVRQMAVTNFDANPELLNFANGSLDLRTGELRPHRRNDLCGRVIPYGFDAGADCRLWLQVLNRSMGWHSRCSNAEADRAERLVRYIQTIFGAGATGIAAKALFVLHGPGSNGKTLQVEAVQAALGPYAGKISVESLMASRSAMDNATGSDLADLLGRRFVSASEVAEGSRLAVSRVKSLTGMETIRARRLHENPFSFLPSHKLFLDSNSKPVISSGQDAIWNRIRLVPYLVEIPPAEQDPRLKDKLMDELPGIASWLAEGARRFIVDGLPDDPEVDAATENYRQESDRLKDFLGDCMRFEADLWESITGVWKRYENWCEMNGERYPISKPRFESELERRGVRRGMRDSGRVRAWVGIGFRQEVTK